MQERISLSQNLFYVGLVLMLTAATASAAGWVSGQTTLLAVVVGVGAALALTSRLWLNHLQRSLREHTAHRGQWAVR